MAVTTTISILVLIISISNLRPTVSADDQYTFKPPATYSPLVRPNAGGQPVQVDVSGYIHNVELKNNRLEVVMYFRTQWTDPRLANEKAKSQLTFKAKPLLPLIWTPDPFFVNAVEPTGFINEGHIALFADGKVRLSEMRKEVLICRNSTPAAVIIREELARGHTGPGNNTIVKCSMDIESYGFGTDDIILKANEGSFEIDKEAKDLGLYYVNSVKTVGKVLKLTTQSYSRLSVEIEFDSYLNRMAPGTLMRATQEKW